MTLEFDLSRLAALAKPTVCLASLNDRSIIGLEDRTPFRTLVAAVGDNKRAARLSGRNVTGIKVATHGLCGCLAAIAGMIQSSQVHTASATYGKFGTELDVIAAVVLGGTAFGQGRV